MTPLSQIFRTLKRSPGYTATIVLTLALGIGANTAVFSLIYGILLEPLPYEKGEQLMVLRQHVDSTNPINVSIAEFFDYRDQSQHIDLVEYHPMSFTLLGRARPERVSTGVVSHDFFDVLGINPLHGRFFVESDEEHGTEAVLLLSYGYFQRSFGGDPAVVGQVFEMNDRPHTVVGVLPPIPQFPNEHDVYMPTVACPFRAAGEQRMHQSRGAFRLLTVFGRRNSAAGGASEGAELVDTEIKAIAERFVPQHAETYGQLGRLGVDTVPLASELTRNARPMLFVLLTTTGLVLLLACTNVANLTVARLLARRRELAVRAALGADRLRLARQSVAESVLLALLGGALGVGLAAGGLGMLKSFAARLSPRAATVDLNPHVLLFALIVALTTGLVFGAAPILSRRLDLASVLRGGGHGSAGGGKTLVRAALVTLQVAVSTILLVGAGLLLRSFDRLQRLDPGFNPDRVLSARIDLNWSKYTSPAQARDFFQQLLAELEGHPSIESAAVGSVAPLTQSGGLNRGIQIEGQPVEDGQPAPTMDMHFVSADYFRTLQIPLDRGRFFDSRDHADAAPVTLINATSAHRFWPDQDPIGRRISLDNGNSWLEVVGVVGDVRHYSLDRQAAEELYVPLAQTGFSNRLVVRTRADPAAVASHLRAAVEAVDAEQPVDRIEALEATRTASLATPRTTAWLLTLFAALALGVTAAGVAGVVAWSVGQRVREIGVRMALGAQRKDVMSMVIRQGLLMVVAGLVLGLIGALFFTRLLADLLYETSGSDPATLVAVAAVLLAVGFLACLPPARRAVSVDPNEAVRSE